MGKAKKTRKFAEVKRMLNPKDIKPPKPVKKEEEDEVRHVDKTPAALFFRYNTQLGPPYQVIIDTNFINFSIRNKIDLVKGMMDCFSQDAEGEMLRQILQTLQSFNDLRDDFNNMATKFEALEKGLKARTATIEGKMVDMKAGLTHLQQASSQSQSELQTLRRNSGNQNERLAQITVALRRCGIVVERGPYVTTSDKLLVELSLPGFPAEEQLLLVALLKNHAGYKKARPLVLEKVEKACNKLKPPPAALLAALTKLKQPLPNVVDFAAESALWTEVLLAALDLLSGWALAYTSMMQQYSDAAQLDDAALKEWLVQPSRQPFQVQPAFVIAVALAGGQLRSVLQLDMPVERNLQPPNALVLRLRESKSSDTAFTKGAKQLQLAANVLLWGLQVANPRLLAAVKHLEVEGIVLVETRPSPDRLKKYGSSSGGMLMKLEHLLDNIRVVLEY
ncbi:hypothetical protein D9Q98_003628 [Chlorella vulgaris]|uniref:PIN domain-containing protein n=1 Tax=Chlorella vulgaris TaxID=3077 RepID=A0A9D4TTG1_CHLVU|nr:hypothetical protein D9Q98_003628 [Chlorella vulgaris]